LKSVVVAVLLFSGVAQANVLFDKFNGSYKISSRQCEANDTVCENAVEVTVGFDQAQNMNFVVEKLLDGSSVKGWLYEGSTKDATALVSGDVSTSAYWTEYSPKVVRGYGVRRDEVGGPIKFFYEKAYQGNRSDVHTRRYILKP
jgi:hypothetical protein